MNWYKSKKSTGLFQIKQERKLIKITLSHLQLDFFLNPKALSKHFWKSKNKGLTPKIQWKIL